MNLLTFFSNLLIFSPDDFGDNGSGWTAYRTVSIIFIILMGLAAITSIVLVMLTPGNSQGIEALGGSSETFYGKNKGRSTESKLKIGTLVCLGILAVFAIVFFILQVPAIWGLNS